MEITGRERVIRGKLDTDEKLIQNSRLIYQKEEMASNPIIGQSGCYSTIVHEGETTISHSFSLNHLGETEYWETFIWEEGKGLTGYRSGYGEEPGEEDLYLKNIRLAEDEKEQTTQVISYEEKVYQGQGELHDIRICCPQITGMENQEKQKRINKLLKEEVFKACLPDSLEDSNLILEMDCRVTYLSEKMISICCRGQRGRVVHSGAGGLCDWLCLSVNVDLKTERVMELSDLGIDQGRLVDLLLEGQYENLKSWDGTIDQDPINMVYEDNTEETRRRLKGSLNKEDNFNPMDWYVDKTGFILIARFIYADYYEFYLTWEDLLGEAVDGPVSIRLNNPKGLGWNMEEAVDVREDSDILHQYVYAQDEELKKDTCLIGVTDNYRLYGKGDCRSMLLEQEGEFIRLDYAYTSNYMYLPRLWEKDIDGDGFSELAICLHTFHGTGISIEYLLLADRDEQGELLVYEFEREDYLPLLQQHISWEADEAGIQPKVDEKAAGPFIERPKEGEPYQYVMVGDQIAFWDTEEGIQICAELMLMGDEYVIPHYNGTAITATVIWEENSRFSLKDFGIWEED